MVVSEEFKFKAPEIHQVRTQYLEYTATIFHRETNFHPASDNHVRTNEEICREQQRSNYRHKITE